MPEGPASVDVTWPRRSVEVALRTGQGPQGPQGAPGAAGEAGEPGPQGPQGYSGRGLEAIKGTLFSPPDLPPDDEAEIGDAYIVDGDLWVFKPD